MDGYRLLVTLDNHYVWGGQGEWLLSQVARLGLASPPRGVPLGVREIPACGTNDEVLRYHGLDAASLADTIASSLGVHLARRPGALGWGPGARLGSDSRAESA